MKWLISSKFVCSGNLFMVIIGTFLIVSKNFERFATYGPEHGEKVKKKCFFDFICWHFLFFMTRATTLSHKVNRISKRFARYEPEKI